MIRKQLHPFNKTSGKRGPPTLGALIIHLARFPLTASCLVGLLLASAALAANPDVDLIKDVQARQAAAWNAHDATAYANLFTEDGDVVNVLGWWWQGRSAIQSKLSDAFAWVFKDSQLTITDVQTRFIGPSVAVAHVRWTLDGAKVPPGAPAPPREGIQLQVLQKVGQQWLIASFQNTNGVPEHPFPKGPPSKP